MAKSRHLHTDLVSSTRSIRIIFFLLSFATLFFSVVSSLTESQDISNEFIVGFRGYYTRKSRHSFISATLNTSGIGGWQIMKHSPIIENHPNDFDVILFNPKEVKTCVTLLKKHPLIRTVTPQQRIQRVIHSTDENPRNTSAVDTTTETLNRIRRHIGRKLMRAIPKQITSVMQADVLWSLGITGKGVRVAIFDTGLSANHPHFRYIEERIDWTDENNLDDTVGHGTFVAGVIASSKDCLGLAPDATLLIFKVFTNKQQSYTSWFLDAFNYAIMKKIHVLNLSIGGPDFTDQPFVEKVWELTANNVILISAIGNDGPLYGTLNNPGDQMDVIGVGGINFDDEIAKFSSRGMTTWELPHGYGRVKPDIVTYGSLVWGSSVKGSCRSLSGTSVSSPVITGAVSLLLSGVFHLGSDINPASMKQAIMASAKRIPKVNMFEQGMGKLDLLSAYEMLINYKPQASLTPSYIDLSECQYMWPYCTQPIYYTGMPIIVNVTVLNGMDVVGYINEEPKWYPYVSKNGHFLDISVTYSKILWPWAGWVAVQIAVKEEAVAWSGSAYGHLEVTVESPNRTDRNSVQTSTVKILVKAVITATPPRTKRILWDQYHNIRYPPGYIPRDNLHSKVESLDWNADHIHTNFKDMYEHLRNVGYYVEVLGQPFTCFNASHYGTLLIVDSEEEFFPEERYKLEKDVEAGLSVVVFADWYNTTVMEKVKFFDENSKQWWTPITGGSNVPALNDLLSTWSISFGDGVYNGEYSMQDRSVTFASGSILMKFPSEGTVIAKKLEDQGQIIISGSGKTERVPILGFLQTKNKTTSKKSGRIIVYGDSSCIDKIKVDVKVTDCFWMLDAILQYSMNAHFPSVFKEDNIVLDNELVSLPERMKNSKFYKFSKVLGGNSEHVFQKPLPSCPHLVNLPAYPLNESVSTNFYTSQKMLSWDGNWKLPFSFDEHFRSNEYWLQALKEERLFLLITVILLTVGTTFVIYRYCRSRRKCRCRRNTRLKRFLSAINAARIPSV